MQINERQIAEYEKTLKTLRITDPKVIVGSKNVYQCGTAEATFFDKYGLLVLRIYRSGHTERKRTWKDQLWR